MTYSRLDRCSEDKVVEDKVEEDKVVEFCKILFSVARSAAFIVALLLLLLLLLFLSLPCGIALMRSSRIVKQMCR